MTTAIIPVISVLHMDYLAVAVENTKFCHKVTSTIVTSDRWQVTGTEVTRTTNLNPCALLILLLFNIRYKTRFVDHRSVTRLLRNTFCAWSEFRKSLASPWPAALPKSMASLCLHRRSAEYQVHVIIAKRRKVCNDSYKQKVLLTNWSQYIVRCEQPSYR